MCCLRRGVLIEITEKWRETAEPLVRDVQKAHRELIAGYSEVELETIADFLTRFTGNVMKSIKVLEKEISQPGN